MNSCKSCAVKTVEICYVTPRIVLAAKMLCTLIPILLTDCVGTSPTFVAMDIVRPESDEPSKISAALNKSADMALSGSIAHANGKMLRWKQIEMSIDTSNRNMGHMSLPVMLFEIWIDIKNGSESPLTVYLRDFELSGRDYTITDYSYGAYYLPRNNSSTRVSDATSDEFVLAPGRAANFVVRIRNEQLRLKNVFRMKFRLGGEDLDYYLQARAI